MSTIYIVEDDDNLRELVDYTLRASGFKPKGFAGGREFFSALKEGTPDLVLLDIMLPETDGLEILRKLRGEAETKDMAVIMMTAKDTEIDRIKGFDTGADDYITKPFSVLELVARIKAVLRRTVKEEKGDEISLGGITLRPRERSAYIEDEKIELTLKEYDLLKYLMQNESIVLTRPQIMDKIWGTDFLGETRTVDMHVNFVRQKLGNKAGYIKTVRGLGYKFEVE